MTKLKTPRSTVKYCGLHSSASCASTPIYVYTYVHTYIHTCIYLLIYLSIPLSLSLCAAPHAPARLYMYINTYICIYMYTHTHTHTHAHTHIHEHKHTHTHTYAAPLNKRQHARLLPHLAAHLQAASVLLCIRAHQQELQEICRGERSAIPVRPSIPYRHRVLLVCCHDAD